MHRDEKKKIKIGLNQSKNMIIIISTILREKHQIIVEVIGIKSLADILLPVNSTASEY